MIKVKTYPEILEDMLALFDDKYDKRQGSVLYNLVAPAAREVAIQYTVLKSYEEVNFLDTSTGIFLTRLCRQFGVERLPATASVRLVQFKQEIPLGTRFSVVNSEYNFRVLERRSGFEYSVVAEQVGNAPNYVRGQLINIDVLNGFKGAEIGSVIVVGEDEETDKQLRKRTIEYLKTPTLNGNIAQYKKWASEFVGVGSALVEPLWKGENTVRVSITDADGNEASSELVNKFKNYLDPE
ncbi:baseplate J/gp47 family protein, partial [Streptococcus mitis]